jgi:hypothetical protein
MMPSKVFAASDQIGEQLSRGSGSAVAVSRMPFCCVHHFAEPYVIYAEQRTTGFGGKLAPAHIV